MGTLTSLTVDNIIINGSNIGHTSDTDAIAIASNGQLTLTQTLIGTALDISGDIDIDGTTNLDVVDNTVIPSFPYNGIWYDLMDEDAEESITISSTTDSILLGPGEFKIYGNQASTTLSSVNFISNNLLIYPNLSLH